MNLLSTLLILSALTAAPTAAAPNPTAAPTAAAASGLDAGAPLPLFESAFEEKSDADFDAWPDGWTRRRGPGYPHYVKIGIRKQPSPVGDHCLRMDLDGGAAEISSPPILIDPRYAYLLEGSAKTEGLENDRAYLSLSFLDSQKQALQTFISPKLGGSHDWTKLPIGPEFCRVAGASFAVIGLHLAPTAKADLRGSAMFGGLRLLQTPRIMLRTTNPHNILVAKEPVVIQCEVAGLPASAKKIELEIEDVEGERIATTQKDLTVQDAPPVAGLVDAAAADAVAAHAVPSAAATPNAAGKRAATLVTSTSWQPPITGPGYYRVRVKLPGYNGPLYDYELGFVVIDSQLNDSQHSAVAGEFGWTMPHGETTLTLAALAQLAAQANVNWLKFPLWQSEQDPHRVEQLIDFAERLSSRKIALVGLLADPPPSVWKKLNVTEPPDAATLLAADPKAWYPAIEPVMARMALAVRWWQLGGDNDTSLSGEPGATTAFARAKTELDRIGCDVKCGMAWGWLDESPPQGGPWRFLSRSADPPLTAGELATYLAAGVAGGTPQWVSLAPLAKGGYSRDQRVADLVERMLTAKVHGAAAVFILDPLDGRHGLLNADGAVGELFLPWRSTAAALAGATYAGSLILPGGSQNLLFFRGDEPLLVVWNERPTKEVLYLGDSIVQTDVWGRTTHPAKDGPNDVLPVDRLPTFVAGLNAPVARWRMTLAISRPKLPSVFGQPRAEALKLKNFFDRGVSGQVRLRMPAGWKTTPDTVALELAAGAEIELPFEVSLPFTASTGKQPVRIDFDITADRRYQFGVFRTMQVGMGDVEIEATTQENADGDLEVRQVFINHADEPVSFRCELYAPGRRRLRWDVMNVAAGRDVKIYQLRQAKDLIGETLWIRAEEIGGSRVLNYRFVAQP
jgi:NPCBM-associated, NEW3 domain of alpha-galactosidase